MTLPRLSEFELIDWIRRHNPAPGRAADRIAIGMGDDCAALRFTPGRDAVVTTDMLMEGRHFTLGDQPRKRLAAVGYKALAVNLSDIAAMAAVPVAAVASVALPRERGRLDGARLAKWLHLGLLRAAKGFDVVLVGGDTNAWDGPLVISATVLGEATERGLVRRAGAKPGDAIFVTGALGGSLLGRHYKPRPRVREALALRAAVELHAMIDLSDGLAADLQHILDESGRLGATLDAARIPIHHDAGRFSVQDGQTPLAHALHDGEDFELCFTVDPPAAERLRISPPLRDMMTLAEIGVVTKVPGLRLRHPGGRVETIAPRGFDHFVV